MTNDLLLVLAEILSEARALAREVAARSDAMRATRQIDGQSKDEQGVNHG